MKNAIYNLQTQTPIQMQSNVITTADGKVIAVDPKGVGSFTVACGEGALKVFGVIPEGKGKMGAGDFVRGRKIELGDILE